MIQSLSIHRFVFPDFGAEVLLSGVPSELALLVSEQLGCDHDVVAADGVLSPGGCVHVTKASDPQRIGRVRQIADEHEIHVEETDAGLLVYTVSGCLELPSSGSGGRIELVDREDGFLLVPLEIGIIHQLVQQGIVVFHAAFVELRGVSILLVGASGTGKTTATLAALAAQGSMVSDDSVMLAKKDGAFLVGAFRSDLTIREASLPLLSGAWRSALLPFVTSAEHKWRLRRQELSGLYRSSGVPDYVLLLGALTESEESKLAPLSHSQAFAALAAQTSPVYLTSKRVERSLTMPMLVDFVATVPSFSVRFGRRLLEDPQAEYASLIEQMGAVPT